MRESPRPRRPVSATALRLARPFYRYSTARDAYVPRVAGGRFGPVLIERSGEAEPTPTGRFQRAAEAEHADEHAQ